MVVIIQNIIQKQQRKIYWLLIVYQKIKKNKKINFIQSMKEILSV